MTFIWTDKDAVVDVVEKAIRKIAVEVQGNAKRVAPVDTGTLRASITTAKDQADTVAVTYLVGTNIYYAPFQEFGTSKMPPHPFLGPALEQARARYG